MSWLKIFMKAAFNIEEEDWTQRLCGWTNYRHQLLPTCMTWARCDAVVDLQVRNGRARALAIEPPRTTFSPAAFPAVRSYRQPKHFQQKLPKVWIGNRLAFRCLALLCVGSSSWGFPTRARFQQLHAPLEAHIRKNLDSSPATWFLAAWSESAAVTMSMSE